MKLDVSVLGELLYPDCKKTPIRALGVGSNRTPRKDHPSFLPFLDQYSQRREEQERFCLKKWAILSMIR